MYSLKSINMPSSIFSQIIQVLVESRVKNLRGKVGQCSGANVHNVDNVHVLGCQGRRRHQKASPRSKALAVKAPHSWSFIEKWRLSITVSAMPVGRLRRHSAGSARLRLLSPPRRPNRVPFLKTDAAQPKRQGLTFPFPAHVNTIIL